MLDVGAVAARSGPPVPAVDEAARLVPAIEGLAARTGLPISADTFSPEVARAALAPALSRSTTSAAAGGDVRAGRGVRLRPGDHAYRGAAARGPAPPRYDDPVDHLRDWFSGRIEEALARGVAEEQIALDPGWTSTSPWARTSRSCAGSPSSRSSAARSTCRSRGRISSARCWRVLGEQGARGGSRVGDRRGHHARGRGRRRPAAPPRHQRPAGHANRRRHRRAARRSRLASTRGRRRRLGARPRPGREDGRLVAESSERGDDGEARRPARLAPPRRWPRRSRRRDRVALLPPGRGLRDRAKRST